MKNIAALILIISLSSFTKSGHKPSEEVTNYYGTSDIITFNKADFKLSWSSHPNAVYYKHEYLPKGDIADHFIDMVLLDFVQGDFSAKDALSAQVKTILERKKTDAVCNYQVNQSPDGKQFILDFLMSQSSGNKIELLEWSAYHYKEYTDKAGHKGVLMLGVSHRAYRDGTTALITNLSEFRKENIKALIGIPFPEIQVR
ncbi:hypothetical protein [Mucilaginibacter gilvus]|uniref:Uncharacterized protein n=1 Tax=Mucilaginibacter gilvus TaxID=2305909 RepID=A0A3S3V504_9SPHI|nr:hypothetical protein [Mucilaginibacter gilvus]RWY55809.1 hypothetical protein EPL05_05385 [Mucilaginibacter gilvus]